ncbi:class I SAM-dependent methyltransferase [Oleidesulfovibrio alaskensis]|uniref:class I SAM-dependent methyltransferase n=1 Tax=Oleidesulfovibrio alaskensis TaxID=58180 RepID=UPI0003FC373E|nr:class I SAM-dependent methyltransferase [Oleidesulfovibrio alaskensis]
MRKTYRSEDTRSYWQRRWSAIPADAPMENESAYPLRYALAASAMVRGRMLEAGCGAGRLLRYFFNRGHDIVGMDYIAEAVQKLKETAPSLPVEVGDITGMRFADGEFDCVLAFGLYHNFEPQQLMAALQETARVMRDGGVLCASFRADNLCNRINDRLKQRGTAGGRAFHKLNLREDEFRLMLEAAGFCVERFEYVENMSLLYKFPVWRAAGGKVMNENAARSGGYRLNAAGRFIQAALMRFFSASFAISMWPPPGCGVDL